MAISNSAAQSAIPAAEALSGLIVLEISGTPGASFAAGLLADFNASVYICETPPDGSAMRRRHPKTWWEVSARNKRSIAMNASGAEGEAAVLRLLQWANVVVTDVAEPERANHPWLRLIDRLERKPLLVDVIATGADRPDLWPWSRRADLAAAVTGMMALTGHAKGAPVQPEFPLAEYLSGALAALRAVAELRRLGIKGGSPADITVPLHQAVHRMIEWQIPIATAFGRPELRNGNAFPMNFSISNMHLTKDGSYVTVSAANDAQATKLLEMIGGAALRDDPRFATLQARLQGLSELYKIMDRWMAERTVAEVLQTAERHDVVMGAIFDAKGIAQSEHLRSRGSLAEVQRDDGTPLSMPGVIPRVAGWSAAARSVGPALGAHTVEALAACGIAAASLDRLRKSSAILT